MKYTTRLSLFFIGIILFSNACINPERDQMDYTTPGGQVITNLIHLGILDNTPHGIYVNINGYNPLSSAPLILQLNNANDLSITADGSYQFTSSLLPGQAYNVSILQQPDLPEICTVSNNSGAVKNADITNIDVTCAPEFHTISGTISGLNGDGLKISTNGQKLDILKSDTAFTFVHVPRGTQYDIVVNIQPDNLPQTCTVTSGFGTVQAFDITGVIINCTTASFNVSGTISNFSGTDSLTGLSLRLENTPPGGTKSTTCDLVPTGLPVNNATSAFDFGSSCKILAGYDYTVSITGQPTGKECIAANSTGTISNFAITDVQINCYAALVSISGSITGLSGSNLRVMAVVTPSGGSAYNIYSATLASGATTYTLPSVPSGSTIDASIYIQPYGSPANIWQTCTVSNANQTVPAGGLSNINVNCTTNQYSVIVNVSGTVDPAETLGLNLNSAGVNTVAKSSFPYTFVTKVNSGTSGNVVITESDADFACDLGTANFTVAGSNINVNVNCFSYWKEVSAGAYHTLAIRNDGTLWAWGYNYYGQLGNNTTTNSNIPVKINSSTTWAQVSAGNYHSAARKSDNTIYVWGSNFYGQVGKGSSGSGTEQKTPYQISGTYATISAGAYHTVAINTGGLLYTWGNNGYGQLCLGDYINRTSPTYANISTGKVNLTDTYSTADAGYYHTLLLRSYSYFSGLVIVTYTNSLWGCGYNTYGQLGLTGSTYYPSGSLINSSSWSKISAGGYHSLAVLGGRLYGWGYNADGQLGLGNNTSTSTISTVNSSTTWTHIDAGGYHSTGVFNNYYSYNWGNNANGELAKGNNTDTNTIGSGLTPILKSSGGYQHSAFIKTDYTLWMSGYNGYGQLGTGNYTAVNVMTKVW